MTLEPEAYSSDQRPEPMWRGPGLGISALIVGVLVAIATTIAVQLAANNEYGLALRITFGTIGISLLGVVVGVVAIITKRGRRRAIAGVILSVVANPLVLLYGLSALSKLTI